MSQNLKSLIITSALLVGLSTGVASAYNNGDDYGPDVSIDLSVLKNLDANNIDNYSVPKEIAVPFNRKLLMPGSKGSDAEIILKEPSNKPVSLVPIKHKKPAHKIVKKPVVRKEVATKVISTEAEEEQNEKINNDAVEASNNNRDTQEIRSETEPKKPIRVIVPTVKQDTITIPAEPIDTTAMAGGNKQTTQATEETTPTKTKEPSTTTEEATHATAEEANSANAPQSILPAETNISSESVPASVEGTIKQAFDTDANLTIYFDHAASELTDENKLLITTLIKGVTDKENSLIKIRSYTSSVGDEKVARKTGMYRALNIRYLLSELGIHSSNIEFKLITEKPDVSYSDQVSLTIIAR